MTLWSLGVKNHDLIPIHLSSRSISIFLKNSPYSIIQYSKYPTGFPSLGLQTIHDVNFQVGSFIHSPFSQTSQTLSPSSSSTRLMLSSGSILMYSATGIIIVGPSNRVTTPSLLWLLSIVIPINVLWLSNVEHHSNYDESSSCAT